MSENRDDLKAWLANIIEERFTVDDLDECLGCDGRGDVGDGIVCICCGGSGRISSDPGAPR